MFDEPQLAALCLETIDKNTPEALSADGFTDIDIGKSGSWVYCLILTDTTYNLFEKSNIGFVA